MRRRRTGLTIGSFEVDSDLKYESNPNHPGSLPAKSWVNPEFIESTAEDGEWIYALWDTELQDYIEETEHEGTVLLPELADR